MEREILTKLCFSLSSPTPWWSFEHERVLLSYLFVPFDCWSDSVKVFYPELLLCCWTWRATSISFSCVLSVWACWSGYSDIALPSFGACCISCRYRGIVNWSWFITWKNGRYPPSFTDCAVWLLSRSDGNTFVTMQSRTLCHLPALIDTTGTLSDGDTRMALQLVWISWPLSQVFSNQALQRYQIN